MLKNLLKYKYRHHCERNSLIETAELTVLLVKFQFALYTVNLSFIFHYFTAIFHTKRGTVRIPEYVAFYFCKVTFN